LTLSGLPAGIDSRVWLHLSERGILIGMSRLGLGVLQLGLQRVSLAGRKLAVLSGLLRPGFGVSQLGLQRVSLAGRKLAIALGLLRLGFGVP